MTTISLISANEESSRRWICTLRHALTDSDEVFPDAESFQQHLEDQHHLLVPREGEDLAAAAARFLAEHPGVENCLQCYELRAPWASRPAIQPGRPRLLFRQGRHRRLSHCHQRGKRRGVRVHA